MIDILTLTRANVRRQLLTLLFSNPGREVFQRELARKLNRSIGNIRQEIVRFERAGLITRRQSGNIVFFALNRKHPLYREIESIIHKTIGIAPTIAEALKDIDGISLAFIYGSYASGLSGSRQQWNDRSDIDLFIVGKVDAVTINKSIRVLESKVGREINYSVYSNEEFLGRLQGKNSFLLNILTRPVIPLKGFGDTALNHNLVVNPAKDGINLIEICKTILSDGLKKQGMSNRKKRGRTR